MTYSLGLKNMSKTQDLLWASWSPMVREQEDRLLRFNDVPKLSSEVEPNMPQTLIALTFYGLYKTSEIGFRLRVEFWNGLLYIYISLCIYSYIYTQIKTNR